MTIAYNSRRWDLIERRSGMWKYPLYSKTIADESHNGRLLLAVVKFSSIHHSRPISRYKGVRDDREEGKEVREKERECAKLILASAYASACCAYIKDYACMGGVPAKRTAYIGIIFRSASRSGRRLFLAKS